ncbi:hypothetical protein HDU99_004578, partial [Rhizoclosmatium hyalinum]
MSIGLSASDISTILSLHNTFRSAHGQGPLVWDDSIATFAVNWAQHSASFDGCADPASLAITGRTWRGQHLGTQHRIWFK